MYHPNGPSNGSPKNSIGTLIVTAVLLTVALDELIKAVNKIYKL